MKHTFHLKAAKEEVFDYFIDVLLQDVLAYTGQTLSPQSVKRRLYLPEKLIEQPEEIPDRDRPADGISLSGALCRDLYAR